MVNEQSSNKMVSVDGDRSGVKIRTMKDIYDIIHHDESKQKNFVKLSQKNSLIEIERDRLFNLLFYLETMDANQQNASRRSERTPLKSVMDVVRSG